MRTIFLAALGATFLCSSAMAASGARQFSDNAAYENTQNRMGVAWRSPSSISQHFLNFLQQRSGASVLDIGSGYGTVAVAALQRDAEVIANDLDVRHLDELARRAEMACGDDSCSVARLTVMPGSFPEVTHGQLPPGSLDAIHAAWVMHFMDGQELEAAVAEMVRLLVPGGLVYGSVASLTPGEWPNLQAEMARRIQDRHPFPGFFANTDLFDDWTHHGQRNASARFHFLDATVLTRVFTAHGLDMVMVGLAPRASTNALAGKRQKLDTEWIAKKPCGRLAPSHRPGPETATRLLPPS